MEEKAEIAQEIKAAFEKLDQLIADERATWRNFIRGNVVNSATELTAGSLRRSSALVGMGMVAGAAIAGVGFTIAKRNHEQKIRLDRTDANPAAITTPAR